jgi:AhpD family alkylhydroperoxidase
MVIEPLYLEVDVLDHQLLAETQRFKTTRDRFRIDAPSAIGSFLDFKSAAMAEGDLDPATRALIAVVLAVAHQSERCIMTHTEAAFQAGVTRAQLIAGLSLAVVFGGAPGYGFATVALDSFDTFARTAAA